MTTAINKNWQTFLSLLEEGKDTGEVINSSMSDAGRAIREKVAKEIAERRKNFFYNPWIGWVKWLED